MPLIPWAEVANDVTFVMCLTDLAGKIVQVSPAWGQLSAVASPEGVACHEALGVESSYWDTLTSAMASGDKRSIYGPSWEGLVSRVRSEIFDGFLLSLRPLPEIDPDRDMIELRNALVRLPLGVLIVGVSKEGESRRITENDEYWRLTGFTRGKTPIREVAARLYEADRRTQLPVARLPGVRAITSRMPASDELHLKLPDGGWRVLSVHTAPLPDSPTGERRGICYLSDVTEDWEAKLALRNHRQNLQVALDAAQIGTWRHEVQTGRVYFDERGRQQYGASSLEIDISESFARVHPDDAGWLGPTKAEAIDPERSRGHYALVYRVVHPDKKVRWLSVHFWVHFEGEGPQRRAVRSYGTCQDITERKALEDQLLQSQKMETIGRLAGGVAHDFNNILVVILGYTELLEEALVDGQIQADDIAEIRKAGERARALTGQLLAVARRQVTQPRRIDVNAVIDESARFLQRSVGESIEIERALDPRALPVFIDPVQLNQVLLNLVVNARDAMPGGGKVQIKTSRHEATRDEIQAGAEPGCYASIEVSDSGEGLSSEAQAHLFEPFFTTKKEGSGTGLGLAIVHGVVQQAGGLVRASSERGRGTSFRILLPLQSGQPTEPAQGLRLSEGQGRGGSVLLVEDDDAVRSLAARALRVGGLDVIVASSGNEAMAARPPALDLLITDVVMPGMSGKQLVERMRTEHPGLRVLYVSGYAQDLILHRDALGPTTFFLPKPFTASELVGKVREIIGAG